MWLTDNLRIFPLFAGSEPTLFVKNEAHQMSTYHQKTTWTYAHDICSRQNTFHPAFAYSTEITSRPMGNPMYGSRRCILRHTFMFRIVSVISSRTWYNDECNSNIYAMRICSSVSSHCFTTKMCSVTIILH
jgi:hypothetical protein